MPLTAGLPAGRLAFFFSDVEGSTRLLAGLGDAYAPLHGEHQRLIRSAFAQHAGTEVSTEGDSFFAVFGAATDALAAAADAQRWLDAFDWPSGYPFRVRMGIHVGQAILAGDNYVGIDINRAARIANAANGGQVVLSDEAARAIGGELPAGLRLLDLGRHRLKDVGVERLWQLAIEGIETRSGSLRTLEAHPSNLPAQTTPLVDRQDELVALRGLIGDNPLVTVTGAGGIGKSRLAIEAARAVLPDYPDGVFFLDLAPIDRVDTVIDELAMLIDIRVPPSGDATDSLLHHLRDRRVLLVLETADRHAGIATLVARITENCPTTRVLVTARMPLHLRAEQELAVQPLAVPAPRVGTEVAANSPAVELFVRRAQAVNPAFRLTDANVEGVSGIVRRLDGLPLAIELAAAASRLLSPAAILDRLEKSMPLPGSAAIDVPERQRTLANTIAWSYDLLQPSEQAVLQRLSVFVGEFDLSGVAAVTGGQEPGDELVPLDALAGLVDRSLVFRVEHEGQDRYRMLRAIRDFAATELAAAGDSETSRTRHARYIVEVAARETEALLGQNETAALAELDRLGDDFRAALEWASGTGQAEHLGLRLATALARFWYLRGRVHEGAAWLERVIAVDHDAPPAIRAEALHWLGVMLDEQREEARAIERLDEALAVQRELGDAEAIARELNSLGVVHRNNGDLDLAESLLTESLMRRRASGDAPGAATVLTNLGIVALDREQSSEAIVLLREALEIDRQSGARGGSAYSSTALGTALLRNGQREEALSLLRSALAVFHDHEDADGVAEILERLAEASATADPARAARLLFAAQAIRDRERIGLRPIDERPVNELVASITAALSPVELSAARADSAVMDAEAAVAYALADSGL